MKQRISAENLLELSPEQQEKLRAWWKPQEGDWWKPVQSNEEQLLKDHKKECCIGNHCGLGDSELWHRDLKKHCLPIMTMGQLIEFLEDSNRFKGLHKSNTDGEYKVYMVFDDNNGWNEYIKSDNELITALWQAVKAIL